MSALQGALGPGEFQVNTTTTGVQADPAVAMDDAGNFVVVIADEEVLPVA